MKFKKSGILVAGILCLGMLAGCGDSKNPVEQMKKNYSPYVTLGTYKGVEYVPTHTEVTDEDVQSQVDSFVSGLSTTENVTEGTCEMGDTVNIDYVGSIDGVEFSGGSTQGSGTSITLGSSGYIDNFDEQVAGHSVGETFDVIVTFPDDYGNEDLNGKEAVFVTTLNSISKTTVPEYNDELVSANTDYTTVTDYEASVRADLEATQKNNDELTDKQNVFTQIMDSTTITEYPQAELEKEAQDIITDIQNSASQNGLDVTTYVMYWYGFTSEEQFYEEVQNTVKSFIEEKMIIVAIANQEGIKVTEEEKNAKIQEILDGYGLTDVADLEGYYTDEDYYYGALSDKVIDFLMENAVQVDSLPETATEEATVEE